MTDTDIEAAEKKRKMKKTIFALGLGGVAGFVGASLVMKLFDSDALPDLGASVEIAAVVGLIYLLMAAMVAVGIFSPKAGASFLNVEDAEELQEQRSVLIYSAIGMLGAGVALIVAALGGVGGVIESGVALGVYVVLSVVAVWLSLKSWKLQDELMRAVGAETAALSYYLLFGVGGTWALLAHMGYVPVPRPLDWLTMFWALMLLAAFIVIGKRGMMEMR